MCFVHFDLEIFFAPQRRAIFISHVARWLRTRRFSEPTFRPSGNKSLEKPNVSRLSYLFAHLDLLSSETFFSLIFSLLHFFSLTLPISAFHLSILSEVWLLNFLRPYMDPMGHESHGFQWLQGTSKPANHCVKCIKMHQIWGGSCFSLNPIPWGLSKGTKNKLYGWSPICGFLKTRCIPPTLHGMFRDMVIPFWAVSCDRWIP